MLGTNIEVSLRDTRIWEYLCRWSPLSQAEYVKGLYKTILVTVLADGLCFEMFREMYPFASRHGTEHLSFAEKVTGIIAFRLLKEYGQCPCCKTGDFVLLPETREQGIQLIVCRSCGTWAANCWFFEWVQMGDDSG